MFRSKNAKNRTAAGSPIVNVQLMQHMSGRNYSKKLGIAVVQGKDGQTYNVPIDENGRVPMDALTGRFVNVRQGVRGGKERSVKLDLSQTASKTYRIPEGGFTPEEIVATGWWAHPNEYDIEGIDDTPKGMMGDFGAQAAKFEKATGGRIAILAPTVGEKQHIAGVLAANFTASELKAAAWDHGLTIIVANPGRGCNGFYRDRQACLDCPSIVIRPYADDETIVHEFQHHLRSVDANREGITKTPFPQSSDGVTLPVLQKGRYEELITLEEAANVAEVTGRTRGLDVSHTGYYDMIPSHPYELKGNFEYDRRLLTGGLGKESRPKKGKRLMSVVEEDFEDTRISELRYKGKKSAKGVAEELRSNGVMEQKKPKKGGKR